MAVIHVEQSTPNRTDWNIADYLEKQSWVKTNQLLLPVVFMSLLMLIGIPGNALVFMVFWKHIKAGSTRVFVLSMAVCDFITNIFSLPFYIVRLRFLYNFPDPGFCQATVVFQRLPVMTSGWLLVAVALDRRHRICQALKPQLNPRQASYLVLVATILASLATFPFVHLYGDLSVPTDRSDVNGSQCGVTKQGPRTFRVLEHSTLMLSFLLGAVTMMFSYAHIAFRLHVQRNKRRQLAAPYGAGGGLAERRSAVREGGGVGSGGPQTNSQRQRNMGGAGDTNMASTSTPSSALQERTTLTPAVSPATASSDDTHAKITVGADTSEEWTAERRKTARRVQADACRRGSRKTGSRTTLMMFVLTVTAMVDFLPFIVLKGMSEEEDEFAYCNKQTGWTLSACMVGLLFPNINSVVNPFIYSFCNPNFRRRCRQLLPGNILNGFRRRCWDYT